MKKTLMRLALVMTAFYAHGQGTLQFDQGVNPTNAPGGFGNIKPGPTGESFIPTLSSIGFAQFYMGDNSPSPVGSTLFVDIWSGSLTNGVLLGQTAPVTVGGLFVGVTTFSFSSPVALAPGSTYYLQPVIQSGDSEIIGVVPGVNYANGTSYFNGTANSGADLWFREGIVVPEPSYFALAALGFVGIFVILRKRSNSNQSKEPSKCRFQVL